MAAQARAGQEGVASAKRPTLSGNRWQEDWSVLADPAIRRQPLDRLKYVPFSARSPLPYVSFGADLRERFEYNDTASLGVGDTRADGYVLDRLQLHADLRLNPHWQAFVQLEDVRTFGRKDISPVDRNPLDLRQGFVVYTGAVGAGQLKLRVGRQEMSFDLQRFISARDGPNVRQAFDAIWINYEIAAWRLIGFWSHPVQYRDRRAFDDVSDRHFQYGGIRVERQIEHAGELSGYYSHWLRDDVHYNDASGSESRRVIDLRYAGRIAHVDWDVEAMGQRGRVGVDRVEAWAFGARAGYTFDTRWALRAGLQADAASGDRRRDDGALNTFNPLFPNGSYFSLAGYTGYRNLIHLKPSLTLQPAQDWQLMLGVGLQWRQTTADGVYLQSGHMLPRTAGSGGRWTGMYGQGRLVWSTNANLSFAAEVVHYEVGRAVRDAGGHDSNYLGVEASLAW